MRKYWYECRRSDEPEHQVKGVKCTCAEIVGELYAKNRSEAWDLVGTLLLIPGIWCCELGTPGGKVRYELQLKVE